MIGELALARWPNTPLTVLARVLPFGITDVVPDVLRRCTDCVSAF